MLGALKLQAGFSSYPLPQLPQDWDETVISRLMSMDIEQGRYVKIVFIQAQLSPRQTLDDQLCPTFVFG